MRINYLNLKSYNTYKKQAFLNKNFTFKTISTIKVQILEQHNNA